MLPPTEADLILEQELMAGNIPNSELAKLLDSIDIRRFSGRTSSE